MTRLLGTVLALLGLSAVAFALTPGTAPADDAKVAALLLAVAAAAVLLPGGLTSVVASGLLTVFGLAVAYRWGRGSDELAASLQPAAAPVVAVSLALGALAVLTAYGPQLQPRSPDPAKLPVPWFAAGSAALAALLLGAAALQGSPGWGAVAVAVAVLGPVAAYAGDAPRRLLGAVLGTVGAAVALWEQLSQEPTGPYLVIEPTHLPLMLGLANTPRLPVPVAAGLLLAAGAVLAAGPRPPARGTAAQTAAGPRPAVPDTAGG